MDKKIGVMLVDDHAILRGGLKLLINSQDDMMVLADTGQPEEALPLYYQYKPDIIILDLSLTGQSGLDVLETLRDNNIEVKVLVLTMHEDEAYLSEVLRLGGIGYILKKAADVELLSAIRAVYRGEIVIDSTLTQAALRILCQAEKKQDMLRNELTQREKEVLRLVCLGFTNRQIAEKLVISIKTVETHKANLKEKLHLYKRSELVSYAMEEDLFDVRVDNKIK
jgi:two-component system response regulator NreC